MFTLDPYVNMREEPSRSSLTGLTQVKSNVGHGEGASGLTGLIKAVIALEHRVIPPNMHFSHPNPKSTPE